MPSPSTTQLLGDEMPTFEGLLATCNRTIKSLERGEIAPPVGNAIHNGIGTVVRLVKLELEAAKLLNRTPTLLPRMLPPMPAGGHPAVLDVGQVQEPMLEASGG